MSGTCLGGIVADVDRKLYCSTNTVNTGVQGRTEQCAELVVLVVLITRRKPDIDAKTGDYVVAPTKSPHTFSSLSTRKLRFSIPLRLYSISAISGCSASWWMVDS